MINLKLLFSSRRLQNVVHHFTPITRVTDADTQTPVFRGTKMCRYILQSVMTPNTATILEAELTGWNIQFVMNHQNFRRLNTMKTRQRANRHA